MDRVRLRRRDAAATPPPRRHAAAPPPRRPRLRRFDLSLPEVALDLTGFAGIIVAVYGVSYAYYLQNKMDAAAAKDAKKAAADKKKAAAAKKAEADAAKAAKAAAADAVVASSTEPPAEAS